eukprot:3671875-Alexandrium_andersonii.AAC.1
MHPSGASGTKFEALLGPSQFKLRTPRAIFAWSDPSMGVLGSVGSGPVVVGSVDRFGSVGICA